MFAKTRRKCIPAGSIAASLLLTVLTNLSISRTSSARRGNIDIAFILSNLEPAEEPRFQDQDRDVG